MGTTKTYGLGGGVAGTSEIDDNTDDAVLWKDTAGIEMFELDSTNGSGYVAISADTDASNGKPYLKLNESGNYVELAANGYARIFGSANDLYAYAANKFEMLQTASTSWRIRLVDESNYDLLVVDGDASNFTYAFQAADSGVFKITDDAGSPVRYFSITEGGNVELGRTSAGNTQLYGTNIQFRANNRAHLSVQDNGSYGSVYFNGSALLNAISHYGARVWATKTASHGDFTLKSSATFSLQPAQNVTAATKANPCVVTVSSHRLQSGDSVLFDSVGGMTQLNGNTYVITKIDSNSFSLNSTDSSAFGTYTSGGTIGAVADSTLDADFITQSGLDATQHAQVTQTSSVTVVNENATHDFTFKFAPKSGNGSVEALDVDASNLTDGTGITLAPSQVARFEIVTVRIGGTAVSNQIHMIRCVGRTQSLSALKQGTGTDTATTQPVYLADTNATLIIDFANGNVGDVTLAAAVTAVKFFNVPPDGTAATVTARITQGSSNHTLDYSDSAVTVYSDSGSSSLTGEIKFSGGVHHTQSTGSGEVDVISFTSIPTGSTFHIYAAVIGQNFS
jgi:hypothetical protein